MRSTNLHLYEGISASHLHAGSEADSSKDFRDQDDVLRVLQEIETLGLLPSGRSIYYKSDAFTYLDLYKETASEYGLQASLYTSSKMIAVGKLSKATSSSTKKQSTLNSYF